MTATDDAIGDALDAILAAGFDASEHSSVGATATSEIAIRAAIRSDHLIPADDREALMRALGAVQVGWHHSDNPDRSFYRLHTGTVWSTHGTSPGTKMVRCSDCPDCVPVWTLGEGKP